MSIKSKKPVRLTPAKLEKLAVEFLTYLQQHDLFNYVYIYVNGKCYSDTKCSNLSIYQSTAYGKYFITPGVSVQEMMEYCNPDTISVKFDGALYYEINQGSGRVNEHLDKLFRKYGMCWEQGYPSDFSLYYDD